MLDWRKAASLDVSRVALMDELKALSMVAYLGDSMVDVMDDHMVDEMVDDSVDMKDELKADERV